MKKVEYLQRMKTVRKELQMSQEEIAYRIGNQQAQYQKYESGVHEIPLRYFTKFCQITGASADWLLSLNATK